MGGYYSEQSRAEKVGQLFDKIAPKYDLLNDLQSFGLHRRWKKKLLKLAAPTPAESVLDLATGTGDLVRMGRVMAPDARWAGLDFTFEMLRHGIRGSPMVQADILHLPFGDGRFSVVTMAYGMRNVSDRKQAISEVARVLSTNGRFLFLEFAKPRNGLLRVIYFAWLKIVQPVLGALFFGDPETYRYISRSLENYPELEQVSCELEQGGFSRVEVYRLFGGIMSIHAAYRG